MTSKLLKIVVTTASVLALLCAFSAQAAAQATATVAGTVKDAQGGVIPGATITLVSETRGTMFTGVSSETGDFVMTNLPGDTYTIRISMDGFKTTERKGVAASPGDRVSAGTFSIEVGTLSETVMVSGDAPMIQAQTGERSFTITRETVEDLPMAGRNFASFATLAPGVSGTTRLDGARTNYTLDGISNVNTGGNQQGIQLNSDSIAEVKVLTSAFQAEYGRTSGITISGVTKSGSNQFRGSTYDIERRSAWNSNSWAAVRNIPVQAKALSKQRDWGYTIGGPVGKPGGKNSLFFFYSEQFSPRSSGGAVNEFRVPTLLERQGDFSQSTDNAGQPFPYIRDTSLGLACSATNTSGCFNDGGKLGKIPQNRLYGLGLNILNSYPLPNTQGLNYNLQTVAPTVSSNTFQHVIRVDYQASSKLRVSAKYAGQNATVQTNPGSLPGYNDTVFQFPAILVPSATVDYTLNASTVLEATWGLTQGNQLGSVPNSLYTDPANTKLTNFPRIYPDAGIVPVGSFQEKVLKTMNAPFYQNGRVVLAPRFSWGGRVANAPPTLGYPGFVCMQNTKDFAVSLTKLWGSHTVKAGYQSQNSLKLQELGTVNQGVQPFEGSINFGNDSNNPLDTGFGYANAALGVFTSYAQENSFPEGRYVYRNKDFYVQDNWKMTGKLTLDYGMRFTHHGPQYDQYLQSSNFFPEKWSAAQAPKLFQPGCSTSPIPATGCATANRVALNPLTGASLGAGSSVAIGTIVPNSGVLLNGIIQAGHGIAKENYIEDPMVFGPRIGAAYDLTGAQKVVIRGSFGVFYDRTQGDSVFGQIGNPPTGTSATLVNSTLQSVGAAGTTAVQGAPTLLIYNYDSKIGGSTNWNGGVQMALPWSSSLDVSYVASHNFYSTGAGSGFKVVDQNAPDLGAAYLSQNQDPTLAPSAIPGATALNTDLLRPFRGLGPIVTTWPRYHSQYDSMQVAYNRRFRNGWQAGLNWTLGIRNTGDIASVVHLQHNADGTITDAPDQAALDKLLSNAGIRRHLIKGNFVWSLPQMSGSNGAAKVLEAVVNGWQLSGVFTGGSGSQYDATFSYQTNGASVNLTGSPNYPARIKVIGDPGSGCSSDQYKQFNVAAYQGPTYGSIGNESANNLLTGCWDHTLDLSLSRTIRVGGSRQVQIRLDGFNVLNTVVFSARSTGLQYNNPADPNTLRNPQYNADGTLVATRLTPQTAGAGAVTGAQALRTLQAQIRFTF